MAQTRRISTKEAGKLRHTHGFSDSWAGAETIVTLWDGTVELAEAVVERSKQGYMHSTTDGFYEQGGRWMGRPELKTWADAAGAVKKPWPAGIEMVEGMMGRLRGVELPMPKDLRRRLAWNDEAGDELDLDRFRSGESCWRTTARRDASAPRLVTMAVNVSVSADVGPQEAMWRAVAALTMAEILESRGYRTEIFMLAVGTSVMSTGENVFEGVWVKRAEDVFDVADLVNACSTWFFRTLIFGSYAIYGRPTGCLGYPVQITPGVIRAVDPGCSPNAWIVEGVFSELAAANFARRQLATLAAPDPKKVRAATY